MKMLLIALGLTTSLLAAAAPAEAQRHDGRHSYHGNGYQRHSDHGRRHDYRRHGRHHPYYRHHR